MSLASRLITTSLLLSVALTGGQQPRRRGWHSVRPATHDVAASHSVIVRWVQAGLLSVRRVLDIGANGAGWSSTLASQLTRVQTPLPFFLLVEGNPEHRLSLETRCQPNAKARAKAKRSVLVIPSCEWEIALVGASEGQNVTFHTSKLDRVTPGTPSVGGASVFAESSRFYSDAIETLQSLTTIDSIVRRHGGQRFDLIKIDIQGSEAPALHGANRTLAGASVVLLEVSALQYNKGAALMFETMTILRSHGFIVCESSGGLRTPNQQFVLQMDLVFCRLGSRLLNATSTGFPAPQTPPADVASRKAYVAALRNLLDQATAEERTT